MGCRANFSQIFLINFGANESRPLALRCHDGHSHAVSVISYQQLLKMAESTRDGHPAEGRSRKHESPTVSSAASLPLPRMPGYLHDSSGNEVENEAKKRNGTR